MGGFQVSTRVLALLIWFGGMLPGRAAVPEWAEHLTIWALPEIRTLDAEHVVIAEKLKSLPMSAAINSGIRRGFQTGRVRKNEALWVELELPSPSEVDEVVLVPMLGKGARGDVPGFGFPSRFQLEAVDENEETHLLIEDTGDDFPSPGIHPVIVECPPGLQIKRIRLTATEPWTHGGPQVLALSEMLVLSGNRNLAADGRVFASSSREMRPTWASNNLIDMATPLGLPVVPDAPALLGWHCEVSTVSDARKSVTVDLGKDVRLDSIQLAPVWRPGSPSPLNYGFPSRFRVEVANTEDFSDGRSIYDRTDQPPRPPRPEHSVLPGG